MSFNQKGNFLQQIPPVTRNLIIINVAIWVVIAILGNASSAMRQYADWLLQHLGLNFWGADSFNPIQTITYMFVHDPSSPLHILFNMFTLWMFGRLMEQVWGSQRFFIFYFVCGFGAAVVQEVVWQLSWQHDFITALARANGLTFDSMRGIIDQGLATGSADVMAGIARYKASMITVGASGAIFGILLGFAFMFPNMPLYLFFIPIPIKAKYMVIGYGVLEFYLGVSSQGSSVAHFAHLGGMLFGLILLLYWKKKGTLGGNYFH